MVFHSTKTGNYRARTKHHVVSDNDVMFDDRRRIGCKQSTDAGSGTNEDAVQYQRADTHLCAGRHKGHRRYQIRDGNISLTEIMKNFAGSPGGISAKRYDGCRITLSHFTQAVHNSSEAWYAQSSARIWIVIVKALDLKLVR
jgi:hypothetical protein